MGQADNEVQHIEIDKMTDLRTSPNQLLPHIQLTPCVSPSQPKNISSFFLSMIRRKWAMEGGCGGEGERERERGIERKVGKKKREKRMET